MVEEEIREDLARSNGNFFSTSAFLALTIGIPFCIFKFLFGVLGIRIGTGNDLSIVTVFGWTVVIWASVDFFMNLIGIGLNLLKRKSFIEYCLIAQVGCLFKRPSLFLCIDTVISFLIICFVLWSGWIVKLKQFEAYLWYAATTINLVSLSLVNVWTEFRVNSDKKS